MPPRPSLPAERRSDCPISVALDLLGDRWSLLVVRDLVFTKRRRFREFLSAPEAIASNILAERLERLECAGIVSRRPDPKDRRSSIFGLTPKGRDLAPVLVQLVLWSAKHEQTGTPREVLTRMRGDTEGFLRALREKLDKEGAGGGAESGTRK